MFPDVGLQQNDETVSSLTVCQKNVMNSYHFPTPWG